MERTSPAFTAWRLVAVLVLSLFSLLNTATDIVLPWHPFADLGLTIDAAGTIIGVDPGRSAERAGIRVGDRIDMTATPFESRRFLINGVAAVPAGERLHVAVLRDGRRLAFDLTGEIRPRSLADNVTDEILMLAQLLTLGIGGWLLLVRPSTMSWAFFFYCAFETGTAATTNAIEPASIVVINNGLWFALAAASFVPFAIFALRFPNDRAAGWRARAQTLLFLSLILVLPLGAYSGIAYPLGLPNAIVSSVTSTISIAGLLFVALTFVISYAHAPAVDRAKIRWVGLGLVIGQAGPLTFTIFSSLPGISVVFPIWELDLIQSLQMAIPISVAYAVVRHRVFDVRFVLGRAAIYGILTTLVVTLISLVDYVAGKVISETKLAALGDAAIAIAIGLSLNGLHRRAESAVERVFFRERRRAEQRLHRVGEGLMHAESGQAITNAIVAELTAALKIVSCAVFQRDGDRFARRVALGWSDRTETHIGLSDPAVLQLTAESRPLATRDGLWPDGLLPTGERAPVYALPVMVRGRLDAIVFLGAHIGGEQIDPEELATVGRLLEAAAFAYEHVEAQAAIVHAAALANEVATLRGLIIGGMQADPSTSSG